MGKAETLSQLKEVQAIFQQRTIVALLTEKPPVLKEKTDAK